MQTTMSSNQDTKMLWKVEPLSPSGTSSSFDIDEEWLCFDEKPNLVFENTGEQPVLSEEQLTRAQVASKFLEELELKDWIKEESFADWLEEKIDLPIFEELPAPECGQNRAIVYPSGVVKQQHHHHQSVGQQHVDATQTLLREFETVLGDVEACHQINSTGVVLTLTPPQSPPPLNKQHLLVSLQPLHQPQAAFVYEQQHQRHQEESASTASSLGSHEHEHQHSNNYTISGESVNDSINHQIDTQWNAENLSLVPLVHGSDVAHELAKVDEYVRSCCEDVALASGSSSGSSSSSPSSPCTSSNASCISSEDSADDPDWCFDTSTAVPVTEGRRSGQARGNRRPKPYTRPSIEDKRVRKKEQNKNAATRYRQKKKQEIKEILGEEQELATRNERLQTQVKDLQREIGYLKGLMRDLFKAKGLIK